MTILQGVRAFLEGSVGGDGDGEEGGGPSAEGHEDQPPVEVVYKKGVRVNGANEHDRDAALSEVSFSFGCVVVYTCVRFLHTIRGMFFAVPPFFMAWHAAAFFRGLRSTRSFFRCVWFSLFNGGLLCSFLAS